MIDLTDEQINKLSIMALGWPLDDTQTSRRILDLLDFSAEEVGMVLSAFPVIERFSTAYNSAREKLQQQDYKIAEFLSAKQGYIYVFHLFDGVCKIGFSANPQSRFETIKFATQKYLTACNKIGLFNPEICTTIETPHCTWAEKLLHAKYKSKRVHLSYHDSKNSNAYFASLDLTTELFRLSYEDIDYLKSVEYLQPDWWNEVSILFQSKEY